MNVTEDVVGTGLALLKLLRVARHSSILLPYQGCRAAPLKPVSRQVRGAGFFLALLNQSVDFER